MLKLRFKSAHFALAMGVGACAEAQAADTPDIEMWRLDCGQMIIDDETYLGRKSDGQYLRRGLSSYLI